MKANPFQEWRRCDRLQQADIDDLTRSGVGILALAMAEDGSGFCLARDRVVLHPDGRRFEFSRFSRSPWLDVEAFVILALDRDGEPVDLVAFPVEGVPFIATWLGKVGLLGEDQIECPRLGDSLRVHAGVLDWLRADRTGVVVVDPIRAAPLLRDVGTLSVASWQQKHRLADMLAVRLPRIVVDTVIRVEAAE